MTRGTLLLIFMIGSLHRSAPQNCSYPLSQYSDQFNSVSPSGNLEEFIKESVVILRDQPFNCSGTITGVTIRVNKYDSDFNRTLRFGEKQGIYVYFILISGEEKNNVQSVRGFAVNNDMLTRQVEAGSSWYTTLERAFSPVKVEGGDIVGIYIPQDGFDGVTFIQPLSRLNSGTALMVYGQYVNVTSSNDISDVLGNALVNEDITSDTVAVQAPLIQFTFAATDATPSSATPSSASDGPDLILTVVAHVVVVLAVILFIIVVAIILFIVGVKKCRAAKKGPAAVEYTEEQNVHFVGMQPSPAYGVLESSKEVDYI